ncbi:hypothetical protein ABTJ97_19285, partial [Acinetobacter baumannii]
RGADLAGPAAPARAQPKTRAEPRPTPRAGPASSRTRLTFHQQHALKTLPSRIETLTKEIEALQRKLADPALYARDRAAFDEATAAVA